MRFTLPERCVSVKMDNSGDDFTSGKIDISERTMSTVKFVKDYSEGVHVAFLGAAKVLGCSEGTASSQMFRSSIQQI